MGRILLWLASPLLRVLSVGNVNRSSFALHNTGRYTYMLRSCMGITHSSVQSGPLFGEITWSSQRLDGLHCCCCCIVFSIALFTFIALQLNLQGYITAISNIPHVRQIADLSPLDDLDSREDLHGIAHATG